MLTVGEDSGRGQRSRERSMQSSMEAWQDREIGGVTTALSDTRGRQRPLSVCQEPGPAAQAPPTAPGCRAWSHKAHMSSGIQLSWEGTCFGNPVIQLPAWVLQ